MREIKFRGLYENKVWVYGNLILGIVEGTPFAQIEQADSNDYHQWEVNRESVGQFTGLKDKNGVEIYEGDVLSAPYTFLGTHGGVVEYVENAFWVTLPVGEKIMPREDLREVIGNIYENPELLEQTQEATA